MPPAVAPAVSGTMREYLQAKGVKLEAQKPAGIQGARHHAADARRAGLRCPIPMCPMRSQ